MIESKQELRSDEEYFDGYEEVQDGAHEIISLLEPVQNFLETVDDDEAAQRVLEFMAWYEQWSEEVPTSRDYMTWDQVIQDFEENFLPGLVKAYGADDEIAIRTAFNDFTDSLCKDSQITEWQYNTQENPY